MTDTALEFALGLALAAALVLMRWLRAPLITQVIAIVAAAVFLATLALSDFLQ